MPVLCCGLGWPCSLAFGRPVHTCRGLGRPEFRRTGISPRRATSHRPSWPSTNTPPRGRQRGGMHLGKLWRSRTALPCGCMLAPTRRPDRCPRQSATGWSGSRPRCCRAGRTWSTTWLCCNTPSLRRATVHPIATTSWPARLLWRSGIRTSRTAMPILPSGSTSSCRRSFSMGPGLTRRWPARIWSLMRARRCPRPWAISWIGQWPTNSGCRGCAAAARAPSASGGRGCGWIRLRAHRCARVVEALR